jgi:hypothetical protein
MNLNTDHYTLQQLEKPNTYAPEAIAHIQNPTPYVAFASGVNVDAMFQSGSSLPPAIILDYMYGVAAYQCWGNRQNGVLEICLREHGGHTPVPLSE